MKRVLIIILLFFSFSLGAQQKQKVSEADYNNKKIEMADSFREEGKIYVVVAILAIILFGLLAYTIMIDSKISKIEKELKGGR